MVAEIVSIEPENTEDTTDPVDRFPEQFRAEIRKARAGIIAAAEALDATSAIAHARSLRSATYRADNFKAGW